MMIAKETVGTPAGEQVGRDGRRGATVLLVDDDEDIREVLFAFRVWQRSRPELARIPILVTTAAPLSSEAMAELSPDIRLPKPFELRELMGAVETLAGRTCGHVGASR